VNRVLRVAEGEETRLVGSAEDLIAAIALGCHLSRVESAMFATVRAGEESAHVVSKSGRSFFVGERGELREIASVDLAPQVPQVRP
jgi:hypothetical protein